MRITFRQFAGDFTTFAPDAFDKQIGNRVNIIVDGLPLTTLVDVLDAKVSEDGKEALITIQVDDSVIFASGLQIASELQVIKK